MTDDGRLEAALEEIARAGEELRAADQLAASGFARIAVTRAYYAVFHAVRARLYAESLDPRSHRGLQHLFNVHFVRTGRYEASVSRLLARLQKFREEADYAEAFVIDVPGALAEIADARHLVERIEGEVRSAA